MFPGFLFTLQEMLYSLPGYFYFIVLMRRKESSYMNHTITDQKKEIELLIQKHETYWKDTSNQIWDLAETKFEEFHSSRLQADVLESMGFQVAFPCKSLPTAFRARYGTTAPVIGILGEFDALPNLGQEADCSEPKPLIQQDGTVKNGHGCGHHLLGCGAMAAAAAIKEYLETHHLPGSVLYFGCPGEENGSGKALMINAHFFDDVDIALSWHPDMKTCFWNQALANLRVSYQFHGTSAHAAACPHLGRSALDACELMNVGVNYLREHVIPEARIHYAYTNAGGTAPNIVQAEAELFYAIRAPKDEDAHAIMERIHNIARGAALMTDTTVTIEEKAHYRSFHNNPVLDQLIEQCLREYHPTVYSQEEMDYAARFVPEASLADSPMDLLPDYNQQKAPAVSTDVGNVSHILPTSAFGIPCFANGNILHSWQITAQGKSSIAHKGMLTAAKILTAAAVEILEDEQLFAAIKHAF